MKKPKQNKDSALTLRVRASLKSRLELRARRRKIPTAELVRDLLEEGLKDAKS